MDLYTEAISALNATLARAQASGRRNMNAMTLATVNRDGRPSTRMVLLKGLDDAGLVFFTDRRSGKGQDLESVPHASVCFYWEPIEAQARIDGRVVELERARAERDFRSRPRAGQVMILASSQSQMLESKAALASAVTSVEQAYPHEVPVPEFWSGYCLVPNFIELWFGSRDRMHERVAYTQSEDGWQKTLLQP
jgi:pyridoxamine 5'-phosphate oxidase